MSMAEVIAMKRPVGRKPARDLVVTALEELCPACGDRLEITQHRHRWIERLDGYLHVIRRDKSCRKRLCPGPRKVCHALEDLRLAFPYHTYGLDVTLEVGERYLRGESLCAIQRDLCARGIEIDQRHTGRVFREFLAISSIALGDEEKRRQELHAQGGIVLMCDGVQFDDRAPVLYVAWDALSGMPLFSERKPFRSEDDLRPILERVKAMGVKVIAIVSDKEKGLVPAVEAVFPDVPYQFCQTHFLKNCAKPLEKDLSALGASALRRATRVHKIAKAIHDAERDEPRASAVATPSGVDLAMLKAVARGEGLSDKEFAKEVCELARQNARVSGKPILDPAELKRHERLEALRELVEDDRKKGAEDAAMGVAMVRSSTA
jgi:Transposase, Mutator family